MKRRRPQAANHLFGDLFSYIVLGLLGLLAIGVVVLGAGVYKSVVRTQLHVEQTGLSISYVQNKVRAYDAAGAVAVEDRDGVNTLTLREYADEDDYATLIYYHDGALREYLLFPGDTFIPEAGDLILELSGFEARLEGNMLTLFVTDETGDAANAHISLRAEGSEGDD